MVTCSCGSKKQAGGNFLELTFFFSAAHTALSHFCPSPSPPKGAEGTDSQRLCPENMGAVNAAPAQWLGPPRPPGSLGHSFHLPDYSMPLCRPSLKSLYFWVNSSIFVAAKKKCKHIVSLASPLLHLALKGLAA